MKPSIVTPPATEPIDLDLAKEQCNLDADLTTAQETLLTIYIANARSFAESSTGLSLVTQTRQVVYYAEDSTSQPFPIPFGPVASIAEVTDGNDSVLTDYELKTFGTQDYFVLKAGVTYPLTVQYITGFGEGTDVPTDIRGAMLCHISDQWVNREKMSKECADTLERVYSGYRNGLSG